MSEKEKVRVSFSDLVEIDNPNGHRLRWVFGHASGVALCKLLKTTGAEGGIRTLTGLLPTDFKRVSAVST